MFWAGREVHRLIATPSRDTLPAADHAIDPGALCAHENPLREPAATGGLGAGRPTCDGNDRVAGRDRAAGIALAGASALAVEP